MTVISAASEIECFAVHVAESDLADLCARLDRVRLPEPETVPADGVSVTRQLDTITLYWLTGTGTSSTRWYWEALSGCRAVRRRKPEMQFYDVTAESTAAPAAVWSLLLDPHSWPVWTPIDALETEQSTGLSTDGRDGIGAVRAFRSGKVVTKERIAALERERRFAYEGVENPYLRDYQAAVELQQTPGGGTRIRWYGTFTARWGTRWFQQWYLRRFMQTMATGLAEYAAKPVGRHNRS